MVMWFDRHVLQKQIMSRKVKVVLIGIFAIFGGIQKAFLLESTEQLSYSFQKTTYDGNEYFFIEKPLLTEDEAHGICHSYGNIASIAHLHQFVFLSGFIHTVYKKNERKESCDLFLMKIEFSSTYAEIKARKANSIMIFDTESQWSHGKNVCAVCSVYVSRKKSMRARSDLCGRDGVYNPEVKSCYGAASEFEYTTTEQSKMACHKYQGYGATQPSLAAPDTLNEHYFITGIIILFISNYKSEYMTDAFMIKSGNSILWVWNSTGLRLPSWIINSVSSQLVFGDRRSIAMKLGKKLEAPMAFGLDKSLKKPKRNIVCQWIVYSSQLAIPKGVSEKLQSLTYYHYEGLVYFFGETKNFKQESKFCGQYGSSGLVDVTVARIFSKRFLKIFSQFMHANIYYYMKLDSDSVANKLSDNCINSCCSSKSRNQRFGYEVTVQRGRELQIRCSIGSEQLVVVCQGAIPLETSTATTLLTRVPKVITDSTTKVPKTCLPTIIDGIVWPETTVNSFTNTSCRSGPGKMVLECLNNGIFDEVNMSGCSSKNVKVLIEQMIQEKSQYKKSELLKKGLENINGFEGNDMFVMVDSLKYLCKSNEAPRNLPSIMVNVFGMATSILKPAISNKWKSIANTQQKRMATKLIKEVERIGFVYTNSANKTAQLNSSVLEFAMIVCEDCQSNQSSKVNLKYDSSIYGQITAEVDRSDSKIRSIAIGSAFLTLQNYLGLESVARSVKISKTTFINSKLIGLSTKSKYLNANVKVKLIHNKFNVGNARRIQCVFWNISSGIGFWDATGCRRDKIHSTTGYTICYCNHLTNFAVLMDTEDVISTSNQGFLNTITLVLMIISIIALLLTMLAHLILKSFRNRKGWVTFNLSACICAGQTLFLLASMKPGNNVLCGIISAVMEYSWLAAFMWMFWQGYYLYKMLIQIFNPQSLPFKWFLITAYGLPVLPIAIATSIKPSAYENISRDICWIKADNGFRWSFAAPIAAVILVNIVIFKMAITAAMSSHGSNSKRKSLILVLKGSASLMSILGLTWTFGFMIPIHSAFASLFVICNASQGLLIFFFHVLINKSANQEMTNRIQKKAFAQSTLSSNSSVGTSMIKIFSAKTTTKASKLPNEERIYKDSRKSYKTSC